MAKLPSLCPHCRKIVPAGQRCPCRPRSQDRPQAERVQAAPWRKEYSSAEYQRNRQLALDLTDGRCSRTGKIIAIKKNGRWYMQGGSVNHKVPLSDGGTHALSNLEPLSNEEHVKYDSFRRRKNKGY